jgi:hypothetical protein
MYILSCFDCDTISSVLDGEQIEDYQCLHCKISFCLDVDDVLDALPSHINPADVPEAIKLL